MSQPQGIIGRAVEYPKSRTVIQLFEEMARRRPLAPAITFGDLSFTYSQLDACAERLAERLRAMGVGAGDFLPLVMRHGPELPLAMLAAMKLAAPFVPVDDAIPPHVQDRMVGALDARLILCSPGGNGPLRGNAAAARSISSAGASAELPRVLVDIGRPGDSGSALGAALPPGRPRLDDIAYGFYTSGSTGEPKCALNIHQGLLNRFLYMSRRFGGQGDDIVLQNSRHVFDSSLWQLLWPLTTGSRVVIPERAGILDLQATVDIIEDYQITMTDFVPSIFNVLVAMMSARPQIATQLASMRRILIGGEEANPGAVQTFRAMLPQVSVVNTYGPTEASIGSVFHEVTDADTGSIPIGRPIDNTYVVIVDDEMRPVEAGDTGEILLGGDCLGLGYLNDPDRTCAAFIDNPFPGIPGTRLYRTGDMGRYLYDGLLHFAGRADQQVKISGLRVELPEIEMALLRHPKVREAKVIVRDTAASRWLLAFVTAVTVGDAGNGTEDAAAGAAPGGALDPAELRSFASGELSALLVPKEFIILDQMPLNANGKADLKALAALADTRDHTAPPDETGKLSDEGRVVWRVWCDLLPVPPTSPEDDFFDLGGDSLTAQKLALRLTDEFGAPVSVRDIAVHPTIAQQADLAARPSAVSAADAGARPAVITASARARIDADTQLPPEIVPLAGAAPCSGAMPTGGGTSRVLLTGATGFVGAHLLHDLLTQTAADVYCLVRASSARGALDRVARNLAEYRLWQDGFAGRVHPVPGDLGRPRLGLDADVYQQLGQCVDTIVHSGARVNLVQGYGAHRAANVTGTIEILRFATAFRGKAVHHISTLGTVADEAGGIALPVPEAPAPLHLPSGGYGQSKWVAERLLDLAAERGITVAVYRLGEMMPHSRTGVPSQRGLPDLLARACLRVGLCFSSPIVLNYTPVDYASRLVVTAIARGESGYFHVRYPEPVAFDELLAALEARFGLSRVSYRQFWHALRDLVASGADEGVLGTFAVAPRADDGTQTDAASALAALFGGGLAATSTVRTDRLMAVAGLRWPPVGRETFERYAAYHDAGIGTLSGGAAR
jgi:amino acid adenylation domain-containing protein/thioester reductase-like protein